MIASREAVRYESISKRFPSFRPKERHAEHRSGTLPGLVGENGAGKSTLGKILAGIYAPDEGRLLIDGRPVRFSSPSDALAAGIGMVHQELAFCENLSVAENLCLGALPSS
jgi:ABC-type sugar transport system ATPase subunit